MSFARDLTEPALAPRSEMESPQLTELMRMSPDRWREFSRGSAIKRAKRSGFLRNVAVALGNSGAPEAFPALTEALSDEEPLVREHAAWALSELQSRSLSSFARPQRWRTASRGCLSACLLISPRRVHGRDVAPQYRVHPRLVSRSGLPEPSQHVLVDAQRDRLLSDPV